jgi:hemolysin activation/secretion protein
VALKAALAGQFSKDVLPPAEKFYLGGPQFDRGFYYGQVTGDSALTGTLELQLNTNVPAPSFLPSWASDLSAQIYAFYDQGETWNNGVGDTDQRLRSTGLGTRFYIAQYAELDLEGVRRLTARPLGGAGVSALPGSAIYWQFLARY